VLAHVPLHNLNQWMWNDGKDGKQKSEISGLKGTIRLPLHFLLPNIKQHPLLSHHRLHIRNPHGNPQISSGTSMRDHRKFAIGKLIIYIPMHMSGQCDVLHIVIRIGTGQVLRPVHVPDLFPKCALQLRTIVRLLPRKPMGEELAPLPVHQVPVNGNHLHIQMT
jgi:hypothetical protein